MVRIVNIRFRSAGKVYSFDAGDAELKKGDHCVVETVRGKELGKVVSGPEERNEEISIHLCGRLSERQLIRILKATGQTGSGKRKR